jgi:hypothetical protein
MSTMLIDSVTATLELLREHEARLESRLVPPVADDAPSRCGDPRARPLLPVSAIAGAHLTQSLYAVGTYE